MGAAVREVCPAGAGFTEEMLLLPEKLLKAKREGASALPSRFSCPWVSTRAFPWQNLPEAREQHCAHAQPLSRVRLSVTPMGGSPPGSSVHGVSQAGILEWVAISSSRGSS